MTTTDQPTPPTSPPEPAEIASLQRQLQAAMERIAELCDRSGPEFLSQTDIQLAAWLATVAATHPQLEEPTSPLNWPAAARAQLEGLISKFRGCETPSGEMPRAEQLRIAAAIHELCEANDCGVDSPNEIADAITMDDDRAWRRMYMPGEVH